jgi:regulator of sigma E protease
VGLVPFLVFLALVSVSLGVLNLLPIPLLDGGHLLYLLIEGVTGRPVPEKVMLGGQVLGGGFLAILFSLAFYNDVTRLISL